MADQLVIPVIVNIEDDDKLYYRVFKRYVRGGRISPGAFKFKDESPKDPFSTDAKKLTTARDSINRARADLRSGLAMICFMARSPREQGFRVWNDPELGNNAHCSVASEHKEDRAIELAMAAWAVDIDTDSCFTPWADP